MINKFVLLYLLLNFFSLNGFIMNKYAPPPYVQISDQLSNKTAKILEEKYHLNLIGTGGGLFKCVNMLSLSFNIQGSLSKDDLRKILIDGVNTFLNEINNDINIRPYLKRYPFLAEDVEIKLFIVDSQRREVFHPEISVAIARSGELVYKTESEQNKTRYGYESVNKEKFEDALKIVQAEGS